MPRDIQYLTVQDHLWINFQVTKHKHFMDFAKLEEGVYYQYGYGASTNLLPQAARYVVGFSKNRPFSEGNEATAFVGLVAFLRLNAFEWQLRDKDGVEFFDRLLANPASAEEEIKRVTRWHLDDHHNSVSEAATWAMETYPKTVEALLKRVAV